MPGLLTFLLFAGVFYLFMRVGCGAHMIHGHGGHGGHGSHGHGGGGHAPSDLKDPVCGMSVRRESAISRNYDGREYWFCSRTCLEKFEANPRNYVGRDV